jgi:hypothetical protein
LDGVKVPRELWEIGGLGSAGTVVCAGCSQQVAVRHERDRLFLSMLTLPAGTPQPPDTEGFVKPQAH